MTKKLVISTVLLAASFTTQSHADTFNFSFTGAGVSGNIELTYGPATDAKYSQAFEVTGISGTFTDTNNGLNIVDAAIGSLVPITHATPDATNLLAPDDFSRFAVAAGLPPMNNGTLSYTNLFWPGGSPQTASDYPFHGGFLDIYGLLFEIGGGRYVNLWSNGILPGTSNVDYGVAVVTRSDALDYVGSVSVVPEPSAIVLVGIGLVGALAWRRDPLRGRTSR
ncbi:PEP-CTERM sorting domain-containing protein [Isosphaeraceae bacterium EP7]